MQQPFPVARTVLFASSCTTHYELNVHRPRHAQQTLCSSPIIDAIFVSSLSALYDPVARPLRQYDAHWPAVCVPIAHAIFVISFTEGEIAQRSSATHDRANFSVTNRGKMTKAKMA